MAVGTYALTSLANLKAYLGVTTSTDDSIMESCIDRATAQIESWVGRPLMSRQFAEWIQGSLPREFSTATYPISSITGIYAGMDSALTVSSATASDIGVTVAITTDPTNLMGGTAECRLTRTTATGTVSISTLSLATYDDTEALVAAINAVSGFSATLVRNVPSWRLHPRAGGDADASSVTLTAANNSAEFSYDGKRGIVRLRSWLGFPRCSEDPMALSTVVVYTGGYTTVPADLEQACLEAAKALFQRRKSDGAVTSESLGDYSYSLRPTSPLASIFSESLGNYREIR